MTSTALAIRGDQTMFDQYQRAVLTAMGIGDDVSNAELASYLHICQRTGLDPFSGQIHLIGRWDKRAGRTVYRPQTGIDGYRVIAQRTCERTSGTLGYGDSQWIGPDGNWTDVWLSSSPPKAAKATVYRNGQPFPAVAHYAEYVPTDRDGKPTGMWSRMAAGQLAKCAEALALRKAFPNDMAGVYTSEEMAQADAAEQPDYRMVNDAERDQRGLMTSSHRVEHTALRRMNEPPPGAVEKLDTTPPDDHWYAHPPQTPAAQAPAVPEAENTPAQPVTTPAPHRTQAGKPALDRLERLEAQVLAGWTNPEVSGAYQRITGEPEWTASSTQVKAARELLEDALAAHGGDGKAANAALRDQFGLHPLEATDA